MSSTRSVPKPTLVLWLGVVACLFSPVVSAQSETGAQAAAGERVETGQQVGYLLADKVYAKPDAHSREVASITRDDQVRVSPVADQDGWYEVYKVGESELEGYAFRPYVSRFGSAGLAAYASGSPRSTGAQPSEDQPLFEVVFAAVPDGAGARRVVREWANVRVGPGIGHEAFGVIRPGVPFQVLGVERGWGRVKLAGDHEVGYVSAALLHSLPEPEPVPAARDADEEPEEADEATHDEPVRSAVIGGAAGGGAAGTPDAGTSQAEALREVLSGSGVDAEATVYVTRTGRKFHREGCKHLRSRTFAIPLAEAMLDYSPCRTCRPLQPTGDGDDD